MTSLTPATMTSLPPLLAGCVVGQETATAITGANVTPGVLNPDLNGGLYLEEPRLFTPPNSPFPGYDPPVPDAAFSSDLSSLNTEINPIVSNFSLDPLLKLSMNSSEPSGISSELAGRLTLARNFISLTRIFGNDKFTTYRVNVFYKEEFHHIIEIIFTFDRVPFDQV